MSISPNGNSGTFSLDIPEPLTIGWWHNRIYRGCTNSQNCLIGHCGHTTEYTKSLSFRGHYPELFKPGTSAPYPRWDARGHHAPRPGDGRRAWDGDGHGHQKAIILGRLYRYFVVDV